MGIVNEPIEDRVGECRVPASAATFHTSSVTFRRLIDQARPGSIGLLCRTGDTNPVVKDCLGFTAKIFEDLHCDIAMSVR